MRSALTLLYLCSLTLIARGEAPSGAERFRKSVEPILADYCYSCHGQGAKKGNVTLDSFKSDEDLLKNRTLWLAVLKNVRTGIMPPNGKDRLTAEELGRLEAWIKRDAFDIDPANVDPGRVTIRRLNRVEYENTIRDLMGVEFRVDDEFPADDTGYGFDTIGDVLSISPILLEKYLQAAKTITTTAVPLIARVPREFDLPRLGFKDVKGMPPAAKHSIYLEGQYTQSFEVPLDGEYEVSLDLSVRGAFDFDPGRCEVSIVVDEKELFKQEFGWENNKVHHLDARLKPSLKAGSHTFAVKIHPLVPIEKKKNAIDLSLVGARVRGPIDSKHWVKAKNYERFFPRDDTPVGKDERLVYAREVLRAFSSKAFRRPVDEASVDRLAAIAERVYSQRGRSFQEGVRQAMVAVLASPRFLFRVEADAAGPANGPFPLIDEYSLATRLSYFLWSTMPDETLFRLAAKGELRKNLREQVTRMVADPKADGLVRNFVGQWLQARDVEGIVITARSILDRDTLRKNRLDSDQENRDVRRAMRQETEKYFEYVLREDRSVRELIDSDYTYLNERLAEHYGIPGVKGPEMRRVTLPEGSPRGGVLTHGTILLATSNPTRTSPVKRGLFVLENILGSPPPPPPDDVPELEETIKAAKGKEMSIREALELHRSKPLCSSCHSRMDPLGFALENFNALGMWRDKDAAAPIAAAGKLISGESFGSVRELKKVIATERRQDFYRCLTEKLMTYALGRGLDYYDTQTVDTIVDRLGREDGRFSALLLGIIESAPFQRRRASAGRPAP